MGESLITPPIAAFYLFFFFNDTATTEIYTLSLHDALPICEPAVELHRVAERVLPRARQVDVEQRGRTRSDRKSTRLNSSHDQISYAVFCLKKKKTCILHKTRDHATVLRVPCIPHAHTGHQY